MSQADGSGTTARMGSASAAAVVTVLGRVDDYFASQLRRVLDKIQPSLNLMKYPGTEISGKIKTQYASLRSRP